MQSLIILLSHIDSFCNRSLFLLPLVNLKILLMNAGMILMREEITGPVTKIEDEEHQWKEDSCADVNSCTAISMTAEHFSTW